ncbi:hypothetical protein [Micromonospora sp. NPDC005171]
MAVGYVTPERVGGAVIRFGPSPTTGRPTVGWLIEVHQGKGSFVAPNPPA